MELCEPGQERDGDGVGGGRAGGREGDMMGGRP